MTRPNGSWRWRTAPLNLRLLASGEEHDAGTRACGGALSVIVHTAVIIGAMYATLSARPTGPARALDTVVVVIAPQEVRHETPPPRAPDVSLRSFQTMTVPELIPIAIPPVDLQEHFDPRDFTAVGVEDGAATGVALTPEQIYDPNALDDPPILLSWPRLDYPESRPQDAIAGRVVVMAVIDTTGRAEPASVRVIQCAQPEFDQPSKQWMLNALFRPALIAGRPVRVLINRALYYTITKSR